MSHAKAIEKNKDVLQRCTTINLYVIDFLRGKDVLNDEQESDLKAETSHLKQRILLLKWLKVVSLDKYESFLEVMKDAEQEHVTNLLTGCAEDDHLPLSDEIHSRLMKIRHKMAEVTRVDSEVIAELRATKSISMTDAEEIRAETVEYAKVSKLISAIMRRSNYCYRSLQKVLRKTLQISAADFLSEGEMPAVHINNNRPDLDGPLSQALNNVITNEKTADTEIKKLLKEMNGLSLNLVKAAPEHSIVVFIYCKKVRSAVNFTQLFNSGRLQQILESILSRLLLTIEPHNTKPLDSLINLEDKEVTALEKFTGIDDWITESRLKTEQQSLEMPGIKAIPQSGWITESRFKTEQQSLEMRGIIAIPQAGWMTESRFKTEQQSLEMRGINAISQSGWTTGTFPSRQKPSFKVSSYGIDASTQTGEGRKKRKRKKRKSKKHNPSSSVWTDKGMKVQLEKKQGNFIEPETLSGNAEVGEVSPKGTEDAFYNPSDVYQSKTESDRTNYFDLLSDESEETVVESVPSERDEATQLEIASTNVKALTKPQQERHQDAFYKPPDVHRRKLASDRTNYFDLLSDESEESVVESVPSERDYELQHTLKKTLVSGSQKEGQQDKTRYGQSMLIPRRDLHVLNADQPSKSYKELASYEARNRELKQHIDFFTKNLKMNEAQNRELNQHIAFLTKNLKMNEKYIEETKEQCAAWEEEKKLQLQGGLTISKD